MKKPVKLTPKDRKRGADGLRFDARLAYLDGRNARALDLNRRADALLKESFERMRNARPAPDAVAV